MKTLFDKTFKNLGYEIDTKIVKSNNADFQCDDLFKLAKTYKKSPIKIGQEFVEAINKDKDFNRYFSEVSFANPGFINIKVSDEYINNNLKLLMDKPILGAEKQNETIVIDYGGPNVAKPLHVGHLRTAIIGQSINNILKFVGNKTIADVHLGDIGTQMGQVIYGIMQDYPNTDFNDIDLTLDYLNETYPKMSALFKENEDVKQKCLQITKDLQDEIKAEYSNASNDKQTNYKILWKKIYDISVHDIKKTYEYLDVYFDLWYGESDAFKQFDQMLPFIEKQGVVRIDDGAKIIDVKEKDDKFDLPPCIIQKSDGAYLYATSDLGTIWQREKDFHPASIIYVTDNRQNMYFIQVFRATKKSKIYSGLLEHYGYGTVNGKDNKPFKTRSGGTMKLNDLINDVKEEFIKMREENKNMDKDDLDKIINAIIKFADLQNDIERNYIFDIKKFSEVNGKTGPYILYTYLRINKLLDKPDGELSNIIYNESDRNLRLKLLEVSNIINLSVKERKPHHIANYLYELSVLANNFYQTNIMKHLSKDQKSDFEIVLNFNNQVIKTLLSLLGINIPKVM